MKTKLGNTWVGDGEPCRVIAEIGINHNGNMYVAKQLILEAALAGCEFVKFQKRTVDVVYSQAELDKPRESPWGTTTREQKHGLEFTPEQYRTLRAWCDEFGVGLIVSAWDQQAADDINQYVVAHKIASACVTDHDLLRHICAFRKPILLSTGMSTLDEIDAAVRIVRAYGNDLIVMQCTSEYPCPDAHCNVSVVPSLRDRYRALAGYSGHEVGLMPTLWAAALGACVVERHITLDRSMYGSDQAASLEIPGLRKLVQYLRSGQASVGNADKARLPSEEPARTKLRRVDACQTPSL